MRGIRLPRISPAMVVAFVALIAALSQTAFAGPVAQLAKLVSGDKVIRKSSLSGSRLRNHTLTGTQINLAKLGTVPSARFAANAASASHANSADSATNASHANSADSATNATNATNASTSSNASTLQGNDASAFMHGRGRVIVGNHDGVLGLASGTTVRWQVATRGATPSVSEIIATYSAAGPASCTTFAQATSSS